MARTTYILDRNRPFLANYLDDCIYDLKNTNANSENANYLDIDGVRRDLNYESKISDRENECIDRLRKELNEQDIIKKVYGDWRSKQIILKTKQDEIKLINFIHELFNIWSSEYGTQFQIYEFPNEIAEPKTMDFQKFKLNEKIDQSILKQDLLSDSTSVFFISGKCYKLVKYDKTQTSFINLYNPNEKKQDEKNQKFSLQYVSQIEEFDSKYFSILQKRFEEKVKKFALTDSEQLQEVDKRYKLLEQELQASCKESGTGIGFMRKNGENFLYMKKDPFIIEFDGIEYGWFPGCKIGVRIQVTNGNYCYGFNGRKRPLVLDHDYYEHPAVYGLEPGKDENKTFKNPTICVATSKFYYRNYDNWFNETNKKELIGIIFELFHRLQLINHLDKDAIVPHRLSEEIFAKYKGRGVEKK